MPGQINVSEETDFDIIRYLQNTGALIYVIDCQSEYVGALQNLVAIVHKALGVNPSINIEVLIHKVDGLTDDFRVETQREIIQRTTDELADLGIENPKITFFTTSIYDRSIHEAFSRIVQRLITETATLESMLNSLCSSSGVEKAFLFDVKSKIYLATDSSPVDPQTYEICSDFIDVTMDIDMLYTGRKDKLEIERKIKRLQAPQILDIANGAATDDADSTHDGRSIAGDSHVESVSSPRAHDYDDDAPPRDPTPLKSISKMHNGIVLYMSQMVRGLALVGFIRSETIEKMALVDYNAEIFSEGLKKIWPQFEGKD